MKAFRKAEVAQALRYRNVTISAAGVLVVIALVGAAQVFVDDNGIAYFRQGTELRNDDAVLTQFFGGTHLTA